MTFLIINSICITGLFTYCTQLYIIGIPHFFWLQATLLFLTNISIGLCTFSDPGTIPSRQFRQRIGESKLDEIKEFVSTQSSWIIIHNGRLQKLKACFECQFYRPFRAVHCDICGTCSLKLDHHCPWVGNCIAKRNYKYFLLFVNSICLLILSTVFGGLANLFYQF